MAEKKRMRTTKSKDSLAKAFIQLVESTPYEDIKINNVCEVAKVQELPSTITFKVWMSSCFIVSKSICLRASRESMRKN